MSVDVSNEQGLERLRSWKDVGATLLLVFNGPNHKDLTIQVTVSGVAQDDSTVIFQWLLLQVDPDVPHMPFATSEGVFAVSLEGSLCRTIPSQP